MIEQTAPARVGLLGNPSDGYGGRTLGLAVPLYSATVTLEPAEGISIEPLPSDVPSWPSAGQLALSVDGFGYGTGPQLLTAVIRTFIDVADSVGAPRPEDFRLSYRTNIPRQVGLAGSSALVVAALRCLAEHTGLEIPREVLPTIALSVETEQLGITAGLQDRVVQVYGGLVAMDFGSMQTDARFGVAHGSYEELDPIGLPALFIAHRVSSAEPSATYHTSLRNRFEAGDPVVREAMRALAALVTEGRAAMRWNDAARVGDLMRQNMMLRRQLGPVNESQYELVEVAAEVGCGATFTGSGGAIVGSYADEAQFAELSAALSAIGADVLRIN